MMVIEFTSKGSFSALLLSYPILLWSKLRGKISTREALAAGHGVGKYQPYKYTKTEIHSKPATNAVLRNYRMTIDKIDQHYLLLGICQPVNDTAETR